MDEKITTINLSKETKTKLTLLKIHPNQSYEEVILNLLKGCEDGILRQSKNDEA